MAKLNIINLGEANVYRLRCYKRLNKYKYVYTFKKLIVSIYFDMNSAK